MDDKTKNQDKVERPETPKGEDPARLNNLNPETNTNEIVKDTDSKQTPEQKKQDEGQVRSPRSERDPGIQKKERNRDEDKPTNPPHKENDSELWATEEQGKTDNAKA